MIALSAAPPTDGQAASEKFPSSADYALMASVQIVLASSSLQHVEAHFPRYEVVPQDAKRVLERVDELLLYAAHQPVLQLQKADLLQTCTAATNDLCLLSHRGLLLSTGCPVAAPDLSQLDSR